MKFLELLQKTAEDGINMLSCFVFQMQGTTIIREDRGVRSNLYPVSLTLNLSPKQFKIFSFREKAHCICPAFQE